MEKLIKGELLQVCGLPEDDPCSWVTHLYIFNNQPLPAF